MLKSYIFYDIESNLLNITYLHVFRRISTFICNSTNILVPKINFFYNISF